MARILCGKLRMAVRRRGSPGGYRTAFLVALLGAMSVQAGQITVQPAGNQGFDVYADGVLVAPIRLAANGAIVADNVVSNATGLVLSGLRATDPLAVTFATNDYVSITLPAPGDTNAEPVVQFHLTLGNFNTNRWLALFPDGPAPFHFLVCPMPTAQVWHQRGWLNATPYADPFPLLQDVHNGLAGDFLPVEPELELHLSAGRASDPDDWPVGPVRRPYMSAMISRARAATDQSERYIATAYCWQQGTPDQLHRAGLSLRRRPLRQPGLSPGRRSARVVVQPRD